MSKSRLTGTRAVWSMIDANLDRVQQLVTHRVYQLLNNLAQNGCG